MGSSRGATVVADKLEAADNLANGEEAEDLSSEHATGGQLGRGQVACRLGKRSRLLDQLGRVLELDPGVLESSLEGREGARVES